MPKESPVPDFGYTPEQIKEMQDFFKSKDFTSKISLQHEVNVTVVKAEAFHKAKYIFVKYWLDNLPGLGIKRQMKNFAKEYPIKLLQDTDGTYFSEQIAEICNDPKKFEATANQFADMYGEQISYRSVADCKRHIANYIDFYNERRPHRANNYRTPDAIEEFYNKKTNPNV